ncbi:MAG TPA: ABC transporter ATP-binding protein [Beutenbergiaceae bacterium]|nr:ABC transporter ATP-binding protein [Beutenbergiaceae bacterium]
MSALSIEDVVVRYGSGMTPTTAVDRVSLQVQQGQVLALLGPSGCGKSSLLRAVAGLEPVAEGRITFNGGDLAGIPVHRRGFGMMFQDGQLFPHRDVAGNIAFGLQMAGLSRPARAARVAELLDLVGLNGYEQRAVASLSGGQAQRAALARALAPRPRLLLLDEPLSALDRELRERLAADLQTILRRAGTSALYVTHDHDEAFTVADWVAVMMTGQIVQQGTGAQLWRAPAGGQVAAFLGYRVQRRDDGTQVAISPEALSVPGDRSDPGDRQTGAAVDPDGEGGPLLSGTVLAVGFSRGRTTVRVDVDSWGEQHAVAEAGTTLEVGQRVQLRADPDQILTLL